MLRLPLRFPYLTQRFISLSSSRHAKPKGGKGSKIGLTVAVEEPEPVRDTELLQTYCCGLNYMKEGEDPKLKDDKEYPDWLWTIHTGRPKTYRDYDPNTREYWYALEKAQEEHRAQIVGPKSFYRPPPTHELEFYSRLQKRK